MRNRIPAARRYQTSFAGPQFSSLSVAQQVQYAVNNQRQLSNYIKGGGLKPMIGEWALAGESRNLRSERPVGVNGGDGTLAVHPCEIRARVRVRRGVGFRI